MHWIIYSFYLQQFLKDIPFQGMAGLENFFEMILQGHNEASRSEPAEEISGGYPTPSQQIRPL